MVLKLKLAFSWRKILAFLGLITALPASQSLADGVETVTFQSHSFLVRRVDFTKEEIQLFWHDDAGKPLRTFTALRALAVKHGQTVLFATNGGMFEEDRSPVGLLVQNGVEKRPLNLRSALLGNFYLHPNGVFCVMANGEAQVVESHAYAGLKVRPLWATQSGPLLVLNGTLNPLFIPGSKNQLIRSGVGVRADGHVIFAISQDLVSFYLMAEFLQSLHCPNALFLDGTISAFDSPQTPEDPHDFGPMIGVISR